MSYRAGVVSDRETSEEFARLEQALNEAQSGFTFKVLHAAPVRYWAGLVVYADGADWNPGSGEGIYRRDKANAAWVFLG